MRDQVLISELAVQPFQTISLETLILETMASQPPSTKQDIIASLFSKRAVEDGNLEESYISHVKIFEDDGEGGGVKARYLTLSGASLSASFSPLAPACPLHLYGCLAAGEADGCPFILGLGDSGSVGEVLRPQGQAQLERDVLQGQDLESRRSTRARGGGRA